MISLHHCSGALIYPMTIFLNAYYVLGLLWVPRDEDRKGSIFETQRLCPGLRDKHELGAN